MWLFITAKIVYTSFKIKMRNLYKAINIINMFKCKCKTQTSDNEPTWTLCYSDICQTVFFCFDSQMNVIYRGTSLKDRLFCWLIYSEYYCKTFQCVGSIYGTESWKTFRHKYQNSQIFANPICSPIMIHSLFKTHFQSLGQFNLYS
jgi:hypothetical protein